MSVISMWKFALFPESDLSRNSEFHLVECCFWRGAAELLVC